MLTNTEVWHLVIVALAKPQQGRKNWVVEPVKRDAEDGLVNQIDIYIFSRLCDGWWSDSYGKGQESSADKSKASKAPKEDDRVWPVCLQGELNLDTILCPWCNILRACIGTGSSPIKVSRVIFIPYLTIRI